MTSRQLALITLYEIEKNGAYVGIELKKQLSASDLSPVDRAFASELVYGVIKNRTRLDYIISKYSKQRLKKISVWILNILRMGIYQLLFLDRVPENAAVNESVKLAKRYGHSASSGFVNGILRNAARNGDVEYPKGREFFEVYYSHPKWLLDMLFEQYGEQAEEIIKNNNQNPSATVRINRLKASADEVISSLLKKEIAALKTDEEFVIKISGYGDISRLEEYKNGLVTPQGLSSYKAAKLVEPKEGEVVLDLCAAPGGKTGAMAELSGDRAKIYSFDLYEHKTELIAKNCERLGIKNAEIKTADATAFMEEFKGMADKVLADVPCSGIGIIRKKPDIKWNKPDGDFSELVEIQRRILLNASMYLKEKGELVYSTCTLNKAENEGVTHSFAKQNGFEIMYEETILPSESTDGFYICKMRT